MKLAFVVAFALALLPFAVNADPIPAVLPTSVVVTPTPSPSPGPTPTPLQTTIPAWATAMPTCCAPTSLPAATMVPTTAPSASVRTTSAPTLTNIVTAGTPPPLNHLPTVTYHLSAAPSAAAPFVSYDYPATTTIAQAEQTAGIHRLAYLNPFLPLTGDFEYAGLNAGGIFSSAQARDCAGKPVAFTSEQPGIMLDIKAPLAALYLQWAIDYTLRGHPNTDTLFIDNFNDFYGVAPKPCDFLSWADWSSALNAVMSQQTTAVPLIANTLAVPAAFATNGPSTANQLSALSAFWGGEYEGCYVTPTGTVAIGTQWLAMENAELQAIAAGKTYLCAISGAWSNQWAASIPTQRLYLYASLLLSYDPYDTLLEEFSKTSAGVSVLPETGLVAYGANPASIVPDANGLYVRTFTGCFFRGQSLGPCAVAVNPTPNALPFALAGSYPFTMALSGGGVLDSDAWVGFSGSTPTSIAPSSAVIAVWTLAIPMGATSPAPLPSPTP